MDNIHLYIIMVRVSNILMYVCLTLVVIYFLFAVYSLYDKSGSKLSYLKPATEQEVISFSELDSKTGSMAFTYSVWLYIDDWNYKYGEKKIIITRDNSQGKACPELALDSTENNVIITMDYYPGGTDEPDSASSPSQTPHPPQHSCPSTHPYAADDPLKIKQSGQGSTHCCKNKELMPGIHGLDNDCITCEAPPCTSYNLTTKEGFADQGCIDGPDIGTGPGKPTSATQEGTNGTSKSQGINVKNEKTPCMLRNIPLQEWVNVIVSAKGRSVDVYLNGLLVNSCLLPGVIKNCPQAALKITPDGGFKGWTSNIRHWDDAISPSEARRVYDLGYAGSIISSFTEKMRLKVSLMKGGNTESSFTI